MTTTPNAKGYVCPNCESQMRVVKTRSRAPGVITRRRECPDCGRRVSTEERPKGPLMTPATNSPAT
jgi:transcriptional regulator NrdR family protein